MTKKQPFGNFQDFSTIAYLRSYAQDLIKKRIPLPDHKEKILSRNKGFKKKLIQCLGEFPRKKVPLNAILYDETDIGECLEEKIYFYSEEGVLIPALLSRPKEKGDKKRPAIIVMPGWLQTKEGPPATGFRDFQIKMAKEGFIVICPDIRSQGERRIIADTQWDNYASSGIAALLGKSFLGMHTWDIIRTIDYLATRNDVDQKRIGITGLCLGGMQAYIAAALENRLKVVVPICATSTYEATINEISHYHIHCLSTYIPHLLKYGDTQDIFALIAPRPLLIINNYNDWWFPVTGFKKVCQEIARVYKAFKATDRFGSVIRSNIHDISPVFAGYAEEWFKKWL